MTRHQPDPIAALREIAPEWARWFCVDKLGTGWAQSERGKPRLYWDAAFRYETLPRGNERTFPQNDMFAINLKTGAVHLAQPDGTVIEVTRKEWDV